MVAAVPCAGPVRDKNMPHVVFDKKIDLEEFCAKFQSITRKEPRIIKIEDIFLNKEKSTALVPSLVIDKLHQDFIMEISAKESKTTLRLYPQTDPQKTDGVKDALGLVAQQLLCTIPDIHITKTNIQDHIPRRIIDKK
ncbi:MAG TPA: hypothetical protein VLA53_06985 [Nitrosopumilaceae archaeon]|nr:hypothetical protein [Nitrosopumilaceae archaeon]